MTKLNYQYWASTCTGGAVANIFFWLWPRRLCYMLLLLVKSGELVLVIKIHVCPLLPSRQLTPMYFPPICARDNKLQSNLESRILECCHGNIWRSSDKEEQRYKAINFSSPVSPFLLPRKRPHWKVWAFCYVLTYSALWIAVIDNNTERKGDSKSMVVGQPQTK